MKTLSITVMTLLLSTSIVFAGINNNLIRLNTTKTVLNETKNLDFDLGDPDNEKILRVRDIKVFEIEEEVSFDFNTKDYLPADFNPYEGLEFSEQVANEADLMFNKVFGEITEKELLKIEDIELYNVEEI